MPEFGESLSKREREILDCVAGGAGNKQIAAELFISQNTVKVHLRNIYVKMGVSSRTEATTQAIRLGLVAVPGAEDMVVDTAVPVPDSAPATIPEVAKALEATVEITPDPASEIEPIVSPIPKQRPWGKIWVGVLLGVLLLAGLAVGINYVNAPTIPIEPILYEEVKLEDNWIQSRPLPVTSAKAAVASFGLDLYLIGGEQDGTVSKDVLLYDTAELIWENKAEKPTAVSEATAVELGGVIFVPGGRDADGQPSNLVEAYSPTNDAWGTVASLPVAVAGGLTLTDGGAIYFIGGSDGQKTLNTVYVYDPGADSWRPLAEMNTARTFASGGVIGNKLYVVGGFDGQTELASCEVYDIGINRWAECAPMLAVRGGAGTAVLLNKLYVIGGGMDAGNKINFSEVYDPAIDAWSLVNTPLLDEDNRWVHVGVASVENRIYTLGGIREDDLATDDNFAYAPLVFQTFIPAASSGSGEN